MKALISKSLLLASAVLALASCAKEQLVLNEKCGGTHVFSATVLSSKTTLGDKGVDNSYPNLWVTGDLLSVNGVTSDPLDEKYNGLASAEFSITGELTTPYIAVYPSAAASSCSVQDKTSDITVPVVQTYAEGTYDPKAYIMAASSSSTALQFEPLMTILKITPTGTSGNIRTITVKSLGGKQLSGKFQYDFAKKTLTSSDAGSDTLSISGPAAGIKVGNPWLICLPAGDYTDGLEICIADYNGTSMTGTATPAKAYAAGVMYAAEIPFVPSYLVGSRGIDIYVNNNGDVRRNHVNFTIDGAGEEITNDKVKTLRGKVGKISGELVFRNIKSFNNIECLVYSAGVASGTSAEVGGSIRCINCPALSGFNGFLAMPNVVKGDIEIDGCPIDWTSTAGQHFTEIEGSLIVRNSSAVRMNTGYFRGVKKIGGDLIYENCTNAFWQFDACTYETIGGQLRLVGNSIFNNFGGLTGIKSVGSVYISKNANIAAAATGKNWDLIQSWIDNGVVAYENVECYDTQGNRVNFRKYPEGTIAIASQADIDAITLSEGNRIDVKNLICEGAGVTDLVWSNIKTKVKTVENLSCDGCSFTMLGNFFKGGANTNGVEVTGNIVLKNLCTGDGQFLNSDNVPTSIGGDMIIENVRVHGWANAGFNMVTEIAGDLCIKTNVMANNAAFTLLKTVGGDMTLDGISIGFNGGRVWNIAGWTIENIAGKLTVQNTQYVDFQGFEKIKSIGSIYVKNNPIPTATFGTVQGWITNGVVAYDKVECYDANGNKVKFNNYPAGSRIITSQADLDAITDGPIVVENLVLAGSNITTTLLANVKNKISSIKNLYVDACAATSLNNLLSTVPVTGDITLKDVCPCTGATYFTSAGFPTEIGGSLVLENVRMHGWAGMGFDKITSIAGNLVIRTEICTTTVTFIGLKSVGGDLILDGIQKGNGGGTVFNCSGWSVENIGGKLSITNTAFNSFTGFTALKSIGSVYLKGNNFSDFSTVQGWINNGVVAYGNVECYKADGSRVTFTDKN
ncbi:MAG: hypothetical protein MJY62_02115 [Bacteroidales bacterium]|nr:hypothetical protein [Bacteroidales bacterium]